MSKDLIVEQVPVGVVRPAPSNARTHSKRQIRQIAASIREFGFVNPVLVDEENRAIVGHGRLEAAEFLNFFTVPVIRLTGLSTTQKRALALADNKIAENAGWDPELLAQELHYLSEIEVDFKVSVTGFSDAEIDLYIDQAGASGDDPRVDELPEETSFEGPVVQMGDLWRLGHHRLLCGDVTNRADFRHLMGRDRAQMAITDPPYNLEINGNVCGLGRIKHREFAMASGEMSADQFTNFLEDVFANLAAFSVGGSIHYIFMDWRHMAEILTAGSQVYTELKNVCVWAKSNAGMGSFYRSRHELVFVFKKGRTHHINNFELGQHGRHRSNVWEYPGVNSLGPGRMEELAMHPTVKPVALVADAIKDCSRRGGIVLDAFAGSGTVFIAAEKTGRCAYAMEIEPRYVETAIRRWEEYTGEEAIHVDSGFSLPALSQARGESCTADDGDHGEGFAKGERCNGA